MRIIDCSLRHVKDPFFSESLNPDWHQQLYYGQGRVEGSVVMENVYTGQELFWHSLFGTYTYTNDSPAASTVHCRSSPFDDGVHNSHGGADGASGKARDSEDSVLSFAPYLRWW